LCLSAEVKTRRRSVGDPYGRVKSRIDVGIIQNDDKEDDNKEDDDIEDDDIEDVGIEEDDREMTI